MSSERRKEKTMEERKEKRKIMYRKKARANIRIDPKIYIKFRNLESINFGIKPSYALRTVCML